MITNLLQIPTSPIIDTQTIKTFTDMGMMGILFLLCFALVLYIVRRGKPADATAGTNAAINAFADMFKQQKDQIEEDRELRKAENEANRLQNKQLQEQYIASVNQLSNAATANAEAIRLNAKNTETLTGIWNDAHQAQITDTTVIKTTVQKIDMVGSEPLQRAIDVLSRVEAAVNQIAAKQTEDREFFTSTINDALSKISDAKSALTKIEDKRATNQNAIIATTITVPEQELKVEAQPT